MIDITVKTLDSQNHNYSVPDDFTVRQFKEKIANSVAIPPDKQRLIYCGRVLQDDKKLSECDVNGKVIHLVQRPPPGPARPANASATPSTSSAQPQSQRQGFAQRINAHDGNSFLLGAFTIPSEVMDPNQVQQIVQQVVSGMGDLGRNATVMSRTSDDGSTVDVHINLGQVPAHGETHNRLKLVQSMIRRANVCLNRLENPNLPSPPNEETQTEENSRSERASSAADAQSAEADAPGQPAGESSPNEPIQAEVLFQQPADGGGFASIAAAAFAAASAYARANGISPSASPSSTSPNGSEATSQSQEQQAGESNGASASASAQPQNGQSGGRPGPPAANAVHPPALAAVLEEMQTLQGRFQPFLAQYQELLQGDRDFEGNTEERGRAQSLFAHVSQILHYISHAYHAVSDIMLDLNQPPPRTLRSRSLLHQPTAVVQAGFPVQAHINVSTTLNAARAATANQTNASGRTNGNSSANNANASTNAGNQSNASESAAQGADNQQTPVNVPLLGSMANPIASLFNSPNPVVFMEVGPSSITIDSISATVASEAGGVPQPIRIAGPRFPGMVFPQVPAQDLIQNLMQAVGQATTQRAANNGQSQARGNTATHPTTSTQTRSTSRPIQTIPLAFPGFPMVSFDPFLPCSSHHVTRLRRPVIPIRAAMQAQQQQQRNAGANAPSDAQLAGMVANMMSALFSHSPNSAGSSSSSGTSSSNSGQGSSRTAPQAGGIPRMLVELMTQWRTAGEATQSATIADFLRTIPDYSYEEGEGLVSDLVMCVARHLSLREFIEVLFGRTEALDRLKATLREFVQNRVLRGNEPNEANIRAAVMELVAVMDVELRSVGDIEIKDGVDYLATMHNFYEQRLSSLISFILNPGDESFGAALYTMCRLIISEDIVLSIHCFRNGQQALERMVQNRVRRIASDLDPFMQHWMITMCSAQIRSMIPNITVRENDVLHYVISTSAAARPPAPSSAKMERASSTAPSTAPAPEIAALPTEPMEIGVSSSEDNVAAAAASPVETAVLAQVDAAVASSILEEACVADLLSSDSAWTRAVPTEWVPIIAEDVQRQRRQSVQRPFSDGYLGSMPSKRRKIMSNGRLRTVVDASSILPDTLRRAVATAGVQPTTSLAELTRDVAANTALNSNFQEHLRTSICRRLNEDKDYQADKFPNAEVMFHCPRNGDNA